MTPAFAAAPANAPSTSVAGDALLADGREWTLPELARALDSTPGAVLPAGTRLCRGAVARVGWRAMGARQVRVVQVRT